MRKLCLGLFAFCAVMYGIAPAHAFNGCSLYEHSYWEGDEFRIGRNYQYAFVYNSYNTTFNDKASSASVPYNCELIIYEHANYEGRYLRLRSGDYHYLGDSWNDVVSSAKCKCRGWREGRYELYH